MGVGLVVDFGASHDVFSYSVHVGHCYCYFVVGCAIIDIKLIGFGHDNAAGDEGDVIDIAYAFIRFPGSEDPFLASSQDSPRFVPVQKGHSYPVYLAGGGDPHAMIEEEPAFGQFDGLAGQPDACSVPEGSPGLEQDPVVAPVFEVG